MFGWLLKKITTPFTHKNKPALDPAHPTEHSKGKLGQSSDCSAITEVLRENEEYLKQNLGESFDLVYRHFHIPFKNTDALIVYISGMVDTRVIDQTILAPLMESLDLSEPKHSIKKPGYVSMLVESGVFTAAIKTTSLWSDICDAILEGETVLLVGQCTEALVLNTRGYANRAVSEPSAESEIRAPRDGFVENIQINASLIRRRIKDYGLRFDNLKIGERTKTVVSLVYIQNLVNEALLKEVKKRLGRIKTDSILAGAYLEEFIEDTPYSIFPQVANTERPDRTCAAILEGRIAILVDTTPFALIVPAVFWDFLQTGGDYYERFFLGSFIRWIRFLALFLSISLSPLYVLLTSFHQEMLPTALALKIAAGRSGVPFPAFIEAFLMEIILEIMKEAGLRMPKPLGQTVSIVGTLVIGQAAVTAGLVSPLMVIIIAVAAISSFAIPAYNMSNSLRLIRFPLLFLSALFGLLGYLAGLIVISLHLMSLRSFGTPYLAPVIPLNSSSARDIFARAPWWRMIKRPDLARPQDQNRQSANDMKPKPPKK
jgi:hypothetical protein